MTTAYYRNPTARAVETAATRASLAFHRRLPGYQPTPLRELPGLAAELGIGTLWLKDEASRLGLPAFKILGASWAIYRALAARLPGFTAPWEDLSELAARLAPLGPLTLTTATDGNHGRAVARMARLLGCASEIFVPAGTALARITAIEDEGARVTVVEGSYDEAVATAAALADAHCLVISDTAWPGYTDVPRWVSDGYGTIFAEVDEQLAARDGASPDVVVVQMGVGALAAAVVAHYAQIVPRPRIIGVEPTGAACILASMRAGEPVAVPGPHRSIMAGLNCDSPSPIAWPTISAGIDLFLAIDDDRAREAMRALAAADVVAGETGAAGLGGLLALCHEPDLAPLRAELGLTSRSRVLLLSTEGATDPVSYAEIVGRSA